MSIGFLLCLPLISHGILKSGPLVPLVSTEAAKTEAWNHPTRTGSLFPVSCSVYLRPRCLNCWFSLSLLNLLLALPLRISFPSVCLLCLFYIFLVTFDNVLLLSRVFHLLPSTEQFYYLTFLESVPLDPDSSNLPICVCRLGSSA